MSKEAGHQDFRKTSVFVTPEVSMTTVLFIWSLVPCLSYVATYHFVRYFKPLGWDSEDGLDTEQRRATQNVARSHKPGRN